jgi:ATP-dependent Clp protease ATP-binding subunit ClpA
LRQLGLELQKVRDAVEFIIGRGDRIVVPGEIGLTPRSKKVIELAVDEARLMQHNYVGTEHLLLGLVREGEGIAAGVLESLGVRLERVRATVLDEKALELLASGVQDADDLVPEPANVEEHGNRFTIRARRVLVRARTETQQYQQERVGTQHLLLSLMREQNGLAFHLLRNLGIDSERILAATQFLTLEEKLNEPGDENGLTTDGKKAIELALDEALQLTQPAIGSEHLLLGLLRSEGIASSVLVTRGLKLDKARAEIRRLVGM